MERILSVENGHALAIGLLILTLLLVIIERVIFRIKAASSQLLKYLSQQKYETIDEISKQTGMSHFRLKVHLSILIEDEFVEFHDSAGIRKYRLAGRGVSERDWLRKLKKL